jgi:cell filamentation protein
VTFDPFGDFETQGYLRNLAKEKDTGIVRRLEHASFITGIDAALERLTKIKRLAYSDVLETHRMLFDAVYPWAGQDRRMTAPDLAISKGPVLFAHPDHLRRAVDYALTHGQDKKFMREKSGVVMVTLLMVIHSLTAMDARSW